MTWLCDSTELIAGAWLSSAYAGHGIRGDQVPSTGTDGAPPLYLALSLPADDAKEVRGLVTRWPAGQLDVGEDGGFTYTGASDYFDWRLYVDGVASATNIGYGAGISRVTLSIGAGGGASFTGAVQLDSALPGGGFSAGSASSFLGAVSLGPALPSGGFFGDASAPAYAPQPRTDSSWSYIQTATLWSLQARDGWTGAKTYAPPVWFLCGHIEEDTRATDSKGDEFVSRARFFTSLPGVKQGDRVMLGASNLADPLAAGASEVRAITQWADAFNALGAPDFKLST